MLRVCAWNPGQDDPYDPYDPLVKDEKDEKDVKDVKMENPPVVPVPAVPDLQSLLPELLRFLQTRHASVPVADAASSTLVAASRRLWRLGALEPQGYGLPPKLAPLGGELGNL